MARTMVGLDIGSTGVRAAEFVPGRRRATLRRFAAVPLPEGVVRAGTVVDGEALTAAIRELWAQGKFGTRNVTLGIANAGVLVRQMDLDWMPPADFRKALRYQVEDALPFPVEDANLDYHLLEELEVPAEGAEPRRVARVLLVAASREVVDAFVEAAQRARLHVRGVDLQPFALVRARTAALVDGPAEVEAIVDIGADVVTVVVHAGGAPRFVRMIPGVGGDSITRAVQQHYHWTWEDAERTKRFVGLPGHATLDPAQLESVTQQTNGLDHPAQQVIVAAAHGLVEEIMTTLEYYRTSVTEGVDTGAQPGDIARLLLAGSGARLGGLHELIQERLAVPVEQLDVRRRIRGPGRAHLADDDPSLVIPAGLCAGVGR